MQGATGKRGPEIADSDIILERKIGEGSFGEVWKGACLQQNVAIKIPKVQTLDIQRLAAFRREVAIMSSYHAPNICLFMGACTVPGQFKIVTELLDGDVQTLLEEVPSLSLFERMKLAKDAARGMTWLHGMNPPVIHRDLKTANLLYAKTGNHYCVKITDFGLSEIKPNDRNLRDKKWAKGTPRFMPPEVMRGETFNEKADVYSFGLVLWEILMGKEPFEEYNNGSLKDFAKAVSKRHERPAIPDTYPEVLRSLMMKCWHPDPAVRPTFAKVSKKLDRVLVHAAIADPQGRRFWEENFLGKEDLEWDKFADAFYTYLNLIMPKQDDKERDAEYYKTYSELNSQSTSTSTSAVGAVDSVTKEETAKGKEKAEEEEEEEEEENENEKEEKLPSNDVLSLRCLKALLIKIDASTKQKWVNVVRFGQLLNWFGPLIRPSHPSPSILDVIRETLAQPWFHGKINSEEAVRRLTGQPPGCFLVRFSSDLKGYTISYVSKTGGKVIHSSIRHVTGQGFSVNTEHTFGSLEELVAHLRDILQLQVPCPGSQYARLFGP